MRASAVECSVDRMNFERFHFCPKLKRGCHKEIGIANIWAFQLIWFNDVASRSKEARDYLHLGCIVRSRCGCHPYEHPLVAPHVSHFRQVPFLTIVKFPHSPQASPS